MGDCKAAPQGEALQSDLFVRSVFALGTPGYGKHQMAAC